MRGIKLPTKNPKYQIKTYSNFENMGVLLYGKFELKISFCAGLKRPTEKLKCQINAILVLNWGRHFQKTLIVI